MARVIVTMKIMPDSPERDIQKIEAQAKQQIAEFAGQSEVNSQQKPVAFGLKALEVTFVMGEEKGSTEELEKKIADTEGVSSVEVTDVRRAVG